MKSMPLLSHTNPANHPNVMGRTPGRITTSTAMRAIAGVGLLLWIGRAMNASDSFNLCLRCHC